jgi:hypothetical protein
MAAFAPAATFRCGLLAFVVVLAWATQGSAQQTGVVGTVRDSTGATVSGADITLTNVDTGETRQATTDEAGQYAIPNVKPASYTIVAEKAGFQRQQVEGVRLDVQLVRTVDFELPLGAVSDQVTVAASSATLQTTESTVSTLFETKVVDELPLNGRNFLQLQLLAPGVTLARGGTFSVVQLAAQNTSIGGGQFSVNGMRDVYNDYILDGVSFKDWIHGTNGMNPSVDAIQEFRTQTSNYTAEFGANAGGVINLVTKSGTNQFHGTAYEFHRNDKFDANNFFSNRAGLDKPPLRRNQFGGTLGGPIFRNRNFFFGSYEGFRENRSRTLISTFPTQKMHSGDFSELLTLPDPVVIHDPKTGVPYPGNIIPADQVLEVMPGYLDAYVPLPNRPGLLNNNIVQGTRVNSTDQFIGRVDHSLSASTQVYGRYAHNAIQDDPVEVNPNFTSTQNNQDDNLAVELTHTLSPSTILQVRFGYNRFHQIVNQNRAFTSPNIASDVLRIAGVATDPAASNAPAFIVPGFDGLSGAPSTPRSWYSNRYEGQASMTFVRGGHMLRAGLHYVYHQETFPEIIIPNGLYVFDGSFTGSPMADMLVGIPQTMLLSPELFDPQFRQPEVMPWVQDDWRITPNLTLNLGLRYERRPWPISRNNTISNILLPPGGGEASVILSGPCEPNPPIRRCETTLPTSTAPNRSTLGDNDNNNFAPRIGFAYKMGESGRTVLRGSYGVFYQAEPFNQFVFLSINPPFVSFYNRFNNQSNFETWDWYNPTAGLPAGGVQFTYIPQNSVTPFLQAWNVGIQRELWGNTLDITYVGNKDTHLWARTWPNQPRPGPGDIDSRRPYTNVSTVAGNEPIGSANYNGLQIRGQRRFSRGLAFLASYTFSKAMTDTQAAETGAFVPDLQDTQNRKANRGLWSADARHRFTLSAIYELPFGQGKLLGRDASGIIGGLISGWQLGGILTLQSGQPLTVTLPYDNPNVGEGAKLPDLIGDPNTGPKTVDKFFNTDAFAAPAPFTFGNAGIGIVTGPGIQQLDLSLVKNVRLTNDVRLEVRVEAFNALNHLIMGDPDTTFGTPGFGQVTSTRLDNREMQFAVRLVF